MTWIKVSLPYPAFFCFVFSICQLETKDSNVPGDGKITREKEAGFLNHWVEDITYTFQ
jgi:hypothetical protein